MNNWTQLTTAHTRVLSHEIADSDASAKWKKSKKGQTGLMFDTENENRPKEITW